MSPPKSIANKEQFFICSESGATRLSHVAFCIYDKYVVGVIDRNHDAVNLSGTIIIVFYVEMQAKMTCMCSNFVLYIIVQIK